MPSRPTDRRHEWLRRVTELLLAGMLVAIGWTHGVLFVEGGSMEPALFPGDLIVYRRIGIAPDRGDMIVFEHRGVLVVHRVAGLLREGALRTHGDANSSLDSDPVAPDSVRGEVVAVVPAGRIAGDLAAQGH